MSAPKELPILFSGPMVRAILEGRKHQTRRVVKPQPMGAITCSPDGEWWDDLWYERDGADPETAGIITCPYSPGDRLWVRETWRTAASLDHLSPHGMASKAIEAGWREQWAPVEYVVDGTTSNWDAIWGPAGKTRVSIHMPRWASRLTLEVTEVRVQRLQEISEEDAIAEGVMYRRGVSASSRHEFELLWDSINGARAGYSWEANPFVWAVTFSVLNRQSTRVD